MARTLKESKTIKLLSNIGIDVKKHYKLKRKAEKLITSLYKPSYTYTVWDHSIRDGFRDIHVRIFTAPDSDKEKTILFFHGGGWATGDIDSYKPVCINIAKHTGYPVVAVDYRLAPEHKFPAAVDDCYFVMNAIHDNYFEGLVPEKIILVGDSAGGNIAAAVSLLARDKGGYVPESQILIYPSTYNDHTENSPFKSIIENGYDYLLTAKMIEDYISLYKNADEDLTNPYFAPLLAEDFSHQPDTLIISAELCPLRDEGEYYGEKLREAGNEVEIYRMKDGLHGFFSMPYSYGKVKTAYEVINDFLEKENQRTRR